jgi:small-conductance mechanosensitive channel
MDILQSLLDNLREFLPTGIAFVLILIFVFVIRAFLDKRYTGSPGHPLRRQVITLILVLVGIVIIILVLPIGDSTRGQLLSLIGIFVAAAIALSSATFVGNTMAGMMLRAIRGFRTGDFIRVGDHFGRVSERGLFHIETQTEDRDLTTLPNLYLVTNPVKVIRSSGTIISAEVSLGYDVPRTKVERLLLEAARAADLQEPFLQILELSDFSVNYRIAGLLPKVRHVISARSRLHSQMLDALHKGGIEIVSPTYMNTRAMSESKHVIPEEERAESPDKKSEIKVTPEDIAFDKAEQAESIERLQEWHQAKTKEIEAVRDQMSEEKDETERDALRDRIEHLESQRQRLTEIIERREKEKGE